MKVWKSIILIIAFLLVCPRGIRANNEYKSYHIFVDSHKAENGFCPEYPQISGLKDKAKEKKINYILRNEALYGAKDYNNNPVFSVNDPDSGYYDYSYKIGIADEYLLSVAYSFTAYGLKDGRPYTIPAHRFFCVTIDIQTAKKIHLTDFMKVDEKLLNSNDGNLEEVNYNSAVNPIFHSFKDAFSIFLNADEKDIFHWRSPEEVLERLTNTNAETNWYITNDKQIYFSTGGGIHGVEIPYQNIADSIYPEYLAILNNDPTYTVHSGDSLRNIWD